MTDFNHQLFVEGCIVEWFINWLLPQCYLECDKWFIIRCMSCYYCSWRMFPSIEQATQLETSRYMRDLIYIYCCESGFIWCAFSPDIFNLQDSSVCLLNSRTRRKRHCHRDNYMLYSQFVTRSMIHCSCTVICTMHWKACFSSPASYWVSYFADVEEKLYHLNADLLSIFCMALYLRSLFFMSDY